MPHAVDRPSFCRFILDTGLWHSVKAPYYWVVSKFDAQAKYMKCSSKIVFAQNAGFALALYAWECVPIVEEAMHRLGLNEDWLDTLSSKMEKSLYWFESTHWMDDKDDLDEFESTNGNMTLEISDLDTEKTARLHYIGSLLVLPEVLDMVTCFLPIFEKLFAAYAPGGTLTLTKLVQFVLDFHLVPHLVPAVCLSDACLEAGEGRELNFTCGRFVEVLCRLVFWSLGLGSCVQQMTPAYTRIVWLVTHLRCTLKSLKDELDKRRRVAPAVAIHEELLQALELDPSMWESVQPPAHRWRNVLCGVGTKRLSLEADSDTYSNSSNSSEDSFEERIRQLRAADLSTIADMRRLRLALLRKEVVSDDSTCCRHTYYVSPDCSPYACIDGHAFANVLSHVRRRPYRRPTIGRLYCADLGVQAKNKSVKRSASGNIAILGHVAAIKPAELWRETH